MQISKRRRFSGDLRATIALEALRGDRTLQEMASRHQVQPNQVGAWKRQAIEGHVALDTPSALPELSIWSAGWKAWGNGNCRQRSEFRRKGHGRPVVINGLNLPVSARRPGMGRRYDHCHNLRKKRVFSRFG